MPAISSGNSILSIPIKIYLQSSLLSLSSSSSSSSSSSKEVFFTAGTSHWTTGSRTLSHDAPGIYDMSDLLCFFQWSQCLMPYYFMVALTAAGFHARMS